MDRMTRANHDGGAIAATGTVAVTNRDACRIRGDGAEQYDGREGEARKQARFHGGILD
jgi:hypothetical protein